MQERKPSFVTIVAIAVAFIGFSAGFFGNNLNKYLSFTKDWKQSVNKSSEDTVITASKELLSSKQSSGFAQENTDAEIRYVKFIVKISDANEVYIAGDFNKWDENSLGLTKTKKNTWETILPLTTGTYNYLCYVDGKEMLDPLNPETAEIKNKKVSVIRVK